MSAIRWTESYEWTKGSETQHNTVKGEVPANYRDESVCLRHWTLSIVGIPIYRKTSVVWTRLFDLFGYPNK